MKQVTNKSSELDISGFLNMSNKMNIIWRRKNQTQKIKSSKKYKLNVRSIQNLKQRSNTWKSPLCS